MKYNLARYSQTISNISIGDVALTTDEMIAVITTTAANIPMPASGTTSGTLVLDSDLGALVHFDEVRYYYASVAPNSTIASGIKFYYRNEVFEVYTELNTYYNANYYYTLLSGTDATRYIRVEHVVTSSGFVNGMQVLNDDTYVDFGTDGTDTDTNFYLSVENNIDDMHELQVFNSGPIKANVKLILEPQHTVADEILSISDSSSGPWYGVYRDEDRIVGTGLWDTGVHVDTEISSDTLVLTGGSTEGTYTTRIVLLDENQRLTFSVADLNYPIVVPEVSFFDDFSSGNVNWTIVFYGSSGPADGGYVTDFTGGNCTIYRDYDIWDDKIGITTTDSYQYGEDWMLTFTFMYQTHKNIINDVQGIYIYPTWPQTDFYLHVYVANGPVGSARIVLNGSAYPLSSVMDWAANINTWFNVRIQRDSTDIRFRIWKTTDNEPTIWGWTGTISPTDLPTTAGIRLYDRALDGDPRTYEKFDNFNLIKDYSASAGSKSIIATDDIDTLENIEVRSSNSRPMDRDTYIWGSGANESTKFTNHSWIADGSLESQSPDWGQQEGYSNTFYEWWYDSVAEDEYVVMKTVRTPTSGNYNRIYFEIRRKSGATYTLLFSNGWYTLGSQQAYYTTYKLVFDQSGGFWIYYYLSRDVNVSGGYYLRYYNSTIGLVSSESRSIAQGGFLYDMDSVYESNGDLWVSDRDMSTVYKQDRDGNLLNSYLATENIRGLFALNDGGCWFIQAYSLIRLDSDGAYVEDLTLPTQTASYVYSDLHGGFWLHDGWNIYHLNSDGSTDFVVEVINLYHIVVLNSGVMTKQHDGSTIIKPTASYISTEHKRVMRTWDYPQNEGGYSGTFDSNRLGARSQGYDDLTSDHASNFPIVIDSQWNSFADWKKVSLRDYTFTTEQYHQLRMTLRSDNSSNSPEVYGIYHQQAIEIPDVYPNNYGTFYLKADISNINAQDVGNYSSDVRAYWFLSE